MKKVIIFSAINVTQGGPLTILHSFADYAASNLSDEFDVFFLVKEKSILKNTPVGVIEFPQSQRTIFHKLYYEYFGFMKLSKQLRPHLWFSLNDCTPSVVSEIQCVYFHNATPFYKISWVDFRFPSRVLLQKFYYHLFYRINIHRNNFIIVQQRFFRDYVQKKFNVTGGKIIIHRPEFTHSKNIDSGQANNNAGTINFFYPTKAFVYKNIHLIIGAIDYLKKKTNHSFKITLTIKGTENLYSRWLKKTAAIHSEVQFVGYLDYNLLTEYYTNSDCLIFPSKLETWGLPLSEAQHFNKFVLAADLKYAHETLGEYPNVLYFNADSAEDLGNRMAEYINNFYNKNITPASAPSKHHSSGNNAMDDLFKQILSQK
jgi:glycosyltransferase involved in cell wall biosynthesis